MLILKSYFFSNIYNICIYLNKTAITFFIGSREQKLKFFLLSFSKLLSMLESKMTNVF